MNFSVKCCVIPAMLFLLSFAAGCGGGNTTGNSPTPSVHNEWSWITGANVVGQSGVYGIQGEANSSNTPGARVYGNAWTDTSGNFWLFGGYGMSSNINEGDLNDLWKFTGNQWTWVSGSNQPEQAGVYGKLGTADATNIPGARYLAANWTDAAGNFWLFGGVGMDSTGTRGQLNDLWKYGGGQWTWMSGANLSNQPGTSDADQPGAYGTRGTAATSNIPGARNSAMTWSDASGNLWLFGGLGVDSTGSLGMLNDLWKYSGGQWTWVNGSDLINQLGIYGTLGTAISDNIPGARVNAMTWMDASGNLWLFGGEGYDATGKGAGCATPPYACELNDLWKYDGNRWTWMGGSNVTNQAGVYGTQGVAASSNVPGARDSATVWADTSGNFWLFGGGGLDSAESLGGLNDLWKYNGSEWIWIGGANAASQPGTYGTQGTFASENIPGARNWSVGWMDKSGNLWLFGGEGLGSTANTLDDPKLNDLWEYKP
jgi:N-acetylneuraminic acid mutarotase